MLGSGVILRWVWLSILLVSIVFRLLRMFFVFMVVMVILRSMRLSGCIVRF